MELNCRKQNRGFSLLEVIIAVAILAIGVVFVLQAFSVSARVAGISSDYIGAAFLAEDKMQEFEFKERQGMLVDELPEGIQEKDKFKCGYLLVDLGADSNLYKLEFDIAWQRANRAEDINISTYLLRNESE